MKMSEAMEIIEKGLKPLGFMVSFEWLHGPFLRSDHFPDKHNGEPLIPTEEEAWILAAKFAMQTQGKVVNIYVIGSDFGPVKGYKDKYIENR